MSEIDFPTVLLSPRDVASESTGVAAIMLAVSFVMLLTINLLHAWSRRRLGDV